jgi:hypothetical protein
MANPVIQSTGTVYDGNSTSNSFVVDAPSGITTGDLLICCIGANTSTTITPPSGWDQVGTEPGHGSQTGHVFKKIAVSADESATDYTFTIAATRTGGAVIFRIDGHDATTPISAVDSSTGGSDSAPVCPTITPGSAETLLIACYVQDDKTLTTEDTGYPSGYTGVYSQQHGAVQGCATGVAWKNHATATATGTATFDTTGISDTWSTYHVAIAPSGGGGGADILDFERGLNRGIGVGICRG